MEQQEDIELAQEPPKVEQQDPPTKASRLYKAIINKNGYNEGNIGSEEVFTKALSDKKNAEAIYSSLQSKGYKEDRIGKKDDFYNTFNEAKQDTPIDKKEPKNPFEIPKKVSQMGL